MYSRASVRQLHPEILTLPFCCTEAQIDCIPVKTRRALPVCLSGSAFRAHTPSVLPGRGRARPTSNYYYCTASNNFLGTALASNAATLVGQWAAPEPCRGCWSFVRPVSKVVINPGELSAAGPGRTRHPGNVLGAPRWSHDRYGNGGEGMGGNGQHVPNCSFVCAASNAPTTGSACNCRPGPAISYGFR